MHMVERMSHVIDVAASLCAKLLQIDPHFVARDVSANLGIFKALLTK
jgi:hypothetical protein